MNGTINTTAGLATCAHCGQPIWWTVYYVRSYSLHAHCIEPFYGRLYRIATPDPGAAT